MLESLVGVKCMRQAYYILITLVIWAFKMFMAL